MIRVVRFEEPIAEADPCGIGSGLSERRAGLFANFGGDFDPVEFHQAVLFGEIKSDDPERGSRREFDGDLLPILRVHLVGNTLGRGSDPAGKPVNPGRTWFGLDPETNRGRAGMPGGGKPQKGIVTEQTRKIQ